MRMCVYVCVFGLCKGISSQHMTLYGTNIPPFKDPEDLPLTCDMWITGNWKPWATKQRWDNY